MEENKIETTAMSAEDYVNELNNIRENTISREEYERVCKENRTLANALTTGGATFGQAEAPVAKPDLLELKKKVMNSNNKTNLEYFTDVLNYRDALIDQEGIDPFLPVNKEYRPTEEDLEKAQEIADGLRECVEYANGDPKIFTVELQRRCGVKNKIKR